MFLFVIRQKPTHSVSVPDVITVAAFKEIRIFQGILFQNFHQLESVGGEGTVFEQINHPSAPYVVVTAPQQRMIRRNRLVSYSSDQGFSFSPRTIAAKSAIMAS